MNTLPFSRNTLLAAGIACALMVGCSAAPHKPDGADNLRSKLTRLQSDPQLGSQAPLAMKDADLAVSAAERPQKDPVLGAHLVLIADRKIDIAQAQAESHLAVEQRKALGEQREAMRLQARTREADSANRRAAAAQADARVQKRDAIAARNEADDARDATAVARDATASAQRETDVARDATADAQREADVARDATADARRNEQEMQRQIAELRAKVTERGLVLTLGDVLFTSGTANLNSGANKHLDKLAAFLNKYPERNTQIEGHTDSIGTDDFNQGLSQRRADAVKAYLVAHGIQAARLTSSGKGENSPVGDNASVTGRQQNRRVEVIIENQLVSSR